MSYGAQRFENFMTNIHEDVSYLLGFLILLKGILWLVCYVIIVYKPNRFEIKNVFITIKIIVI